MIMLRTSPDIMRLRMEIWTGHWEVIEHTRRKPDLNELLDLNCFSRTTVRRAAHVNVKMGVPEAKSIGRCRMTSPISSTKTLQGKRREREREREPAD